MNIEGKPEVTASSTATETTTTSTVTVAPAKPKRAILTRRSDDGWLCWIAARLSQAWDWIDKRDIDKHVVSLAILYGSTLILDWAMKFAEHGNRPGLEIAAIIAAVTAPYMALQTAAIKFYFDSRPAGPGSP
jgi:hypothetical protein